MVLYIRVLIGLEPALKYLPEPVWGTSDELFFFFFQGQDITVLHALAAFGPYKCKS